MKYPNCQAVIPDKLILSESGKIRGGVKSKRKAETSRANGKKNLTKIKYRLKLPFFITGRATKKRVDVGTEYSMKPKGESNE